MPYNGIIVGQAKRPGPHDSPTADFMVDMDRAIDEQQEWELCLAQAAEQEQQDCGDPYSDGDAPPNLTLGDSDDDSEGMPPCLSDVRRPTGAAAFGVRRG